LIVDFFDLRPADTYDYHINNRATSAEVTSFFLSFSDPDESGIQKRLFGFFPFCSTPEEGQSWQTKQDKPTPVFPQPRSQEKGKRQHMM